MNTMAILRRTFDKRLVVQEGSSVIPLLPVVRQRRSEPVLATAAGPAAPPVQARSEVEGGARGARDRRGAQGGGCGGARCP